VNFLVPRLRPFLVTTSRAIKWLSHQLSIMSLIHDFVIERPVIPTKNSKLASVHTGPIQVRVYRALMSYQTNQPQNRQRLKLLAKFNDFDFRNV
jgi:hypothetical protein